MLVHTGAYAAGLLLGTDARALAAAATAVAAAQPLGSPLPPLLLLGGLLRYALREVRQAHALGS